MLDHTLPPRYADALQSHVETGEFWPTPTVTVRIDGAEAFNDRLAAIVLEQEATIRANSAPTAVAGISDGLTAHWQRFNVLNWEYPEIRTLRELVLAGLGRWMRTIGDPDDPQLRIAGISCWANVLRYGERLTLHHHAPAFVSAHYTVRSGFEDGGPMGSVDSGHTIYYRPGLADRSHGGEASIGGESVGRGLGHRAPRLSRTPRLLPELHQTRGEAVSRPVVADLDRDGRVPDATALADPLWWFSMVCPRSRIGGT